MKRDAFVWLAAVTLVIWGCGGEETTGPSGPDLAQPTGLTVTALSDTSVRLTWTNRVANAATIIQRAVGTGEFGAVAEVGVGVQAYVDAGLDEATIYRYRVISRLDGAQSPPSIAASDTTLPKAPGGMSVTAIDGNIVTLAWTDRSAREDGYELERSAGDDRHFAALAALPADASDYRDTNLAGNTTYYYRVRARFFGMRSDWSETAVAATFAAPSGLRVQATSPTEILVQWYDNSLTEEGFELERAPVGSDSWTLHQTLSSDQVSYRDQGLSEGDAYSYRIRAFTSLGVSGYSNQASAQTPPLAPSGLSATVTAIRTAVDLSWTDNSSVETAYEVERRIGDRGAFTQLAVLAAGSTSYRDAGLEGSTRYTYRVRAKLDTLFSVWSNEASATTPVLAPLPPSGLNGRATRSTVVELDWTDNSNDEDGFAVERSLISTAGWQEIARLAADVVRYVDQELQPSTTYYYRVKAFNAYGSSPYSEWISVTTPAPPPPAPTGLTAQALTPYLVDCRWTPVGGDVNSLVLERSLSLTEGWAELAVLPDTAVRYIDRSVQPMTTYYYRLFAVNQYGRSLPSQVASATTPQAPPNAPSGLSAIAPNYYTVVLTWTDNSNDEQGFFLERRSARDREWLIVAQPAADVTNYVDNTVEQNTYYRYRIAAYNGGGNSPYSPEAEVTTPDGPPLAPYNLVVEVPQGTYNALTLSWLPGSQNELGFVVERMAQGEGYFSVIAQTEHGIYGYDDTGLEPETWYTYRVQAWNGTGESAYSDTAGAMTPSLVLYDNDFENDNVGGLPRGAWTTNLYGSARAEVTDTMGHASNKSFHLYDPDTTNSLSWVWLSHDPIDQGVYFACWVRIHVYGQFFILATTAGNFGIWNVAFGANHNILAQNGDAWNQLNDTGADWEEDRWMFIEVRADLAAGTWSVWKDGDLIANGWDLWGNTPQGRIHFITTTTANLPNLPFATSGRDVFLDDMRLEIVLPEGYRAQAVSPVSSGQPLVGPVR